MTTSRLDIATALSTVSGLTGSEFRPSVLSQGVGWAQKTSHERAEGFFVTNWLVYVVVPQEERAAAKWYDANIATVRAALQSVVYVDKDEPVVIPAGDDGNGNLYAVTITARSE